METNIDKFILKLSVAEGAIQTELVTSKPDELNEMQEWVETWTRFNGYSSPIKYEADLNTSFSLMYDEIVRDIQGILNTLDRVVFLQKVKHKLENLKLIIVENKTAEGTFYKHQHLKAQNISSNEMDQHNHLGSDGDFQNFLAVAFNILQNALRYIDELIKTVQSGNLILVTNPPSMPLTASINQRLKIDISQGHIATLFRILHDAKVIDENVKEDIFKFIQNSFGFKNHQSNSTEYLRKKFDQPSENHLKFWAEKFRILQSHIKTIENKTSK